MDTSRNQLPVRFHQAEVINQSIHRIVDDLEKRKMEVLRDVLARRHPRLVDLPDKELSQYLSVITFGLGYALVVLSDTQEPIIFFKPADIPLKPVLGDYSVNFRATVEYAEGQAGKDEFLRIRAQMLFL